MLLTCSLRLRKTGSETRSTPRFLVAWICDPCAVFTDRKRLFMIETFTLPLPRLHFGLLV
jgi:hypothetical protein